MNTFHLSLMRHEAEQRLTDAERLEATASGDVRSDSAHLLRLLALELLLKIVHIVTVGRPSRSGHKYDAIFLALPETVQQRLLTLAGERIGPSALGDNHLAVLAEWGTNFISLRYPYERYENLTESEYRALGRTWVDNGASLDGAVFRYYPEELFGFIYAIRNVADEVSRAKH